MKNIVYFAVDRPFVPLLEYNLRWMRKIDNTDVCVIAPASLEIRRLPRNVHLFRPGSLDIWFTAKLKIVDWPRFGDYDNFIYLDADAFVVRALDEIFAVIADAPGHMHAVVDKQKVGEGDRFHRLDGATLPDIPGYNFGTFGFHRDLSATIREFADFIQEHRHRAKIDQALFNDFFAGKKRLIAPDLQPHVYLYNKRNIYEPVNETTLEDAAVVHFLGNYRSQEGPREKMSAASRIVPRLVQRRLPGMWPKLGLICSALLKK